MAQAVHMIEGINGTYAEMLHKIGIDTVEQLLNRGATAQGRKQIAQQALLQEDKIYEWVHKGDLFRIEGMNVEYVKLLHRIGVYSVSNLGDWNPHTLYGAIDIMNEEERLTLRTPTEEEVAHFVERAQQLSPIEID
ncbi:DUF4332 domain-containing protein [Algivirga pacifica]|uniref:DUF4332 domain-containing protein n=1 Tax=Algivirga pacifica TaxID=1162670 RepID=A0ABP9D870_9BACT